MGEVAAAPAFPEPPIPAPVLVFEFYSLHWTLRTMGRGACPPELSTALVPSWNPGTGAQTH